VVSRARAVLRKLETEEAIDVVDGSGGSDGGTGGGDDGAATEAEGGSSGGGTTQVVFDVGAGEFRGAASADGGRQSADAAAADDEPPASDPETEAVLDELRDVDVDETPPVELMARVQRWQARLDGE
jgi:DNA mismatch repair protein MutS